MSNVNDEIRARLNAFVTELSAHVRETTLRNVAEALKSAEGHSPARRASPQGKSTGAREVRKVAVRKPGRPAKAPVASAPAAQPPVPASLAQLMARIHGYIKSNPGQGVTPIATSLGTSNQDLRFPIRMLVDENKIMSKGKTRGTRYFPR